MVIYVSLGQAGNEAGSVGGMTRSRGSWGVKSRQMRDSRRY